MMREQWRASSISKGPITVHQGTNVRLGTGQEDAGRSLFYQLSEQQVALRRTYLRELVRGRDAINEYQGEYGVSSHNGTGRVGWIICAGAGDIL